MAYRKDIRRTQSSFAIGKTTENAKEKDTLMLIKYLADEAKEDKLLENPQLFKTPIVRNGRQATVGYKPEVWKTWE